MRRDSNHLNPFNRSSQNVQAFVVVVAVVTIAGIFGAAVLLRQGSKVADRQTVIQVTADGFVPATVAVKAGTQIVWKNTDTAPHSVASNPYPQNSTEPGLRSQIILPDGSYSYKPTSHGTIEYHDNTQPTLSGTIKVEQ